MLWNTLREYAQVRTLNNLTNRITHTFAPSKATGQSPINQGSQTGGPWTTCGPHVPSIRPAPDGGTVISYVCIYLLLTSSKVVPSQFKLRCLYKIEKKKVLFYKMCSFSTGAREPSQAVSDKAIDVFFSPLRVKNVD